METDKILILNVNENTYKIDTYQIKYNFDKLYFVISGMDNRGMYFQIKLNHLEIIDENKIRIIMEGE